LRGIDHTRVEWALLGVIAVSCAGLSYLQYRWTGEASRAERTALRAGLREQAQRLARAFDDELRQSCAALLPEAREIHELGRDAAHRGRYQHWASRNDTALFARVGVAAPEKGSLRLFTFDRSGRLTAMEWPDGWENFRQAMTARMRGAGRPPSASLDSTAIELPVFEYGDRTTPELEWLIFELDVDHIRKNTLPRLVAEHLNTTGDALYDVAVTWAHTGSVVYSTTDNWEDVVRGADTTTEIFSPNNGYVPGRAQLWVQGPSPLSRWNMALRRRGGSLDAAVAASRRRNLANSLALIALLGLAAWALVRFTGRSRRLAEMQFRFAAGVSHDLRTPLTAIRGAAFNLADGVVKEPAAVSQYARIIQRNADELTAMIENVLAFSASMRADTASPVERFVIGDLVEHAAAAMAAEVEQAGCRVEVNVAPDLPTVAGDPAALELAVRNLIGNAVRHAKQGGWIGVSAGKADGSVEVRVCDRGPGIPDDERERIFEAFYRGERTRSHRVPGTGLGLSLVKSTVERHRGSVVVQNSAGGGAQFTMRLPAAAEDA
jgi:signal transduction histidine kinase